MKVRFALSKTLQCFLFLRYNKKEAYPSELAADGNVRWKKYSSSKSSHVQVVPNMYDYARTVYTLGSGVFEWQGWAVSEFVANDDVDVTVQCLSAHTFYIDDVHVRPLTGDVYWRSQFVTSLRVTRGFHTIYVPLRAKTKHNFRKNENKS